MMRMSGFIRVIMMISEFQWLPGGRSITKKSELFFKCVFLKRFCFPGAKIKQKCKIEFKKIERLTTRQYLKQHQAKTKKLSKFSP